MKHISCDGAVMDDSHKSNWYVAAAYVEDARTGRNSHFIPEAKYVKRWEWYHHRTPRLLLNLCLGIQLGLVLFEDPSIPGLTLPYYATVPIESFCLLFILSRLIHIWSFMKSRIFFKDSKHVVLLGCIAISNVHDKGNLRGEDPPVPSRQHSKWHNPHRIMPLIGAGIHAEEERRR
ncbi:unnamed protein product [Darwinula stevensoni]|uniref:Uncharacterized protein n=1 Tax=Darwinula stevensoni TaxID=69355 RepID=A0A7R9A158_9CRUS|nr:unnamed protein product [Darwinula stevensoni]CAG0885904.1 unnamed protein product [Darwinula stevensoni]